MRVDLVNFLGSGSSPSPGLLAEWRVGAILEAIAVRDARSGQLYLDIGGQRHPARVASGDQAGPQNGERLQVRVLRNSPVLALETVSTQPTTTSAESAVIADALRKFVPRQQSPALLLANLAWIAQRKSGVETLPRSVVQAAAHLWHALPEAEALADPVALETAIARSGVFLEANLATHRGPPDPRFASDLKTLMLTLQRALQGNGAKPSSTHTDASHAPVPTARGPLTALPAAPATLAVLEEPMQQLNELSRQADGALARLTTVQISNSAPDPAVQSMLIDLPVRHEDRAAVLRLKIERDGSRRRDGDGAESWTVEAAVDLGAIGALHAKVTLVGKRIGVQLRAESPAIVAALSQRTGELEAMLSESGLEVDRVVCLHGMPAGEPGVRAARLLDVRA